MRLAALLAAASTAYASFPSPPPFAGGYVLANGPYGLAKLALLAANASTIPLNRVFIGFLSPTLVYVPGSHTLANTGLNLSASPDGGFAALLASITLLRAGGVNVSLSMGGW
jgi:hypothetical protein